MSQQRRERRQAEEAPPERDPAFLRKVIIGLVIAGALGATYYVGYHRRVHEHDDFARCLAKHDVKCTVPIGARTVPTRKPCSALRSSTSLTSNPIQGDTTKIQQVCTDAGIKHFPTWQFPPMGERVEGAIPLDDLSLRTGCPLK